MPTRWIPKISMPSMESKNEEQLNVYANVWTIQARILYTSKEFNPWWASLYNVGEVSKMLQLMREGGVFIGVLRSVKVCLTC